MGLSLGFSGTPHPSYPALQLAAGDEPIEQRPHQLMPRLKAIHVQKLSRPDVGQSDAYPNLQAILTKPIDWELVRQQYDQMVKYVTAVGLGTAEPAKPAQPFHGCRMAFWSRQPLQNPGPAITLVRHESLQDGKRHGARTRNSVQSSPRK
jgi:Tn3 transposase DDE domain